MMPSELGEPMMRFDFLAFLTRTMTSLWSFWELSMLKNEFGLPEMRVVNVDQSTCKLIAVQSGKRSELLKRFLTTRAPTAQSFTSPFDAHATKSPTSRPAINTTPHALREDVLRLDHHDLRRGPARGALRGAVAGAAQGQVLQGLGREQLLNGVSADSRVPR